MGFWGAALQFAKENPLKSASVHMSLVKDVETEEQQKLLELVAAQHEETWNSYMEKLGHEVHWAKPYKCKGIDPSLFLQGQVPMKSIETMEKMKNSSTAGSYYVMAQKRE